MADQSKAAAADKRQGPPASRAIAAPLEEHAGHVEGVCGAGSDLAFAPRGDVELAEAVRPAGANEVKHAALVAHRAIGAWPTTESGFGRARYSERRKRKPQVKAFLATELPDERLYAPRGQVRWRIGDKRSKTLRHGVSDHKRRSPQSYRVRAKVVVQS